MDQEALMIQQGEDASTTTVVATTVQAPARVDAAELRVQLIHETDLPALREAWNHLAGELPFARWEWNVTWWKHYATRQDQLFVLTLHDEAANLVGIAPWFITHSLAQGHVLRFLGSGEICSDHLSLLCEAGNEVPVARAVAEWLINEGRGRWDLLELVGVDQDDLAITALIQELDHLGMYRDSQVGQSCWQLTFPPSWDSYVQGLSKSRRGRVRALERRVFESGRGRWVLASSLEEAHAVFNTLIALHQRRRKSLGQPGCFASPRFEAFHREVIDQFWPQGRVRLGFAELDGEPAAAEYDLVGGETIYMYQSGMDPDRADERPGWLGSIGALRSAMEAGYLYFDFLRGDEEYKSHWRATDLATVEYRVTADRRRARFRRWGRNRIGQCKQWFKRCLAVR